MTVHDDQQPGDDHGHRPVPSGRPLWRRRRVVAGALGAVVVLGSGGYLLAARSDDGESSAVTDDTGALGSVSASAAVEPSTGTSSVSASPSVAALTPSPVPPSPTSAATTSRSPVATPVAPAATKDEGKANQEIQAAREAARKDGVPLQRPLRARTGAVDGLSTRTETTSEGTIRITTAKGDLTGKQDQLMAADEGRPVGKARCTQRLRFSEAAPPREISTVLLCWRTSDERSVVTLAVSREGKPSAAASTEVISREWTRLG